MKMKTHAWRWSRVAAFALAAGATLSGSAAAGEAPGGAKPAEARIQRGKFLVTTGACNDCHTPTKMGPNGPEIDMTRMLSATPRPWSCRRRRGSRRVHGSRSWGRR
jgi:mono/diheme cytochrome c family protein